MNQEQQDEVIDKITLMNGDQYNLIKAAEEASELATVLLQTATKPGKVDAQEVIDEIGDVQIRLEILKRMYGEVSVRKRIEYKLSKYREYLDHERFKHI